VIYPRAADQPTQRVDLLVVAPHPDDESVTTGALLARYAALGIRTAVVCCTGGEEGEIHRMGDAPEANAATVRPYLGQIRRAELHAACRLLGVDQVRTLGYRDSGMRGTPSTFHLGAFCNANLVEATARLVRIIRELRPSVVVTESAWATYGHPDHVMARRVTRRAFQAAGTWPATAWLGQPWQPDRLYAVHPTADRWGVTAHWDALVAQMRRESGNQPFLSRWSLNAFGDEPVTTRIDVSGYVGVQRAAIGCHRTQFPPTSWWLTMPAAARRIALGTLRLTRLTPRPAPALDESELFPASLPLLATIRQAARSA
jgi:LmbE family N-acetylglucosaminyl deacetylase